MNSTRPPRLLTHDERKAAEAAFAGRPCDPRWSESAKRVYAGLIQAMPLSPNVMDKTPRGGPTDVKDTDIERSPASPPTESPSTEVAGESSAVESSTSAGGQDSSSIPQAVNDRRQALELGWLVDVSEEAQKLGFTFPVTVTKSLWEAGIAPGHLLKEESAHRLRDVLMAFRLRLVGHTTLMPLLYFPAMLAFPPGEVPQPILLSALIQGDDQQGPVATLLLPHEVSMTVLPLN
ncbi:MAG: hypothetical protein NNA21_05200 [Nitrospira sp.]|nr:hypothetical protein [Nitrospira sp.]MCP9461192.1 hypothetical protein [Nitrospira sp.]